MTTRRYNMKLRMVKLTQAAISKAMADRACNVTSQDGCRAVVNARDAAAEAVVDLIWDWFEVSERKRRDRKRRAGRQ